MRPVSRLAWQAVNKAVAKAVGIADEGRRVPLGLAVCAAEIEAFWRAFPSGLTRRGLATAGSPRRAFEPRKGAVPGAERGLPMLPLHLLCNVLSPVARYDDQMETAVTRTAFVRDGQAQLQTQWRETAENTWTVAPPCRADRRPMTPGCRTWPCLRGTNRRLLPATGSRV